MDAERTNSEHQALEDRAAEIRGLARPIAIWEMDDVWKWVDAQADTIESLWAKAQDRQRVIEKLQAEVERVEDVKLLCVKILVVHPDETTEGARYLAADVLSRLTGKTATDLMNTVKEIADGR